MSWKRFSREELIEAPVGPHQYEMGVRFQDVDAAGVIFFACAFEYCSDALFAGLDRFGYPPRRLFDEKIIVTPVKHAECHYLAPLRFADRFRVSVVRAQIDETDFTLGYRLDKLPEGTPAVVTQVHQVCVDATTFKRRALPDDLRHTLLSLAGLSD